MPPQTRYARSGNVNIAYQVFGSGPIDLVLAHGWVSHIEYAWEEPSFARWLTRLGSFARVIQFDKRGTGLSDRVVESELPPLEQRMRDVQAVMDAAGSERAAIMGISEGGPMTALFAATYPERTAALIMYGTYARRIWSPDHYWMPTMEQRQRFFNSIIETWGGDFDLATIAPSMAADPHFKQWWATYLRMGAGPSAALALARMNTDIDVREVLPSIQTPTLVLHRRDDVDLDVRGGRYIAGHIPAARYVELDGVDHLPWVGDAEAIASEVQEFITSTRQASAPDRVLATILFTDIVGAIEKASTLGDRYWRNLLDRHNLLVRRELERFNGREVKNTGDGFLATFDGPARAIRCASAIVRALQEVGIPVGAGLHTGECELIGDNISGIAVHLAARVAAKASGGEVLVSSAVKDLVAGSGIRFQGRGVHVLRGVPGEWRLFAVENS